MCKLDQKNKKNWKKTKVYKNIKFKGNVEKCTRSIKTMILRTL